MLAFRGVYQSSSAYSAGDVVQHGNAGYIAGGVVSPGIAPPASPWFPFAASLVQGVSEILIHRKSLTDLHEAPAVTWNGQTLASLGYPAEYERIPFVSRRYSTLALPTENNRPVSLAATATHIAVLDTSTTPPQVHLYNKAASLQRTIAMPAGFRSGGIALSASRIYVCDVSHTARMLVFDMLGVRETAAEFAVTGEPVDIALRGEQLYTLVDDAVDVYAVAGGIRTAAVLQLAAPLADPGTTLRGLYMGTWTQILASDGPNWRVFSFDEKSVRLQSQEFETAPLTTPVAIAGDGETLFLAVAGSEILNLFYDVSLPLWGVKLSCELGNRNVTASRPFLLGVYPRFLNVAPADDGTVQHQHSLSGQVDYGLTDSGDSPTGTVHSQRFQHVPVSLPITFPALGTEQGWYLTLPAGVQLTHLYNRQMEHRDALNLWTYHAAARRWTTRGFPMGAIGEYTIDLVAE